jgi:nitroreductase
MKQEDILKAYHFRHACKEFDNKKKVSENDFNFILETARLSPSSFGFEPWKILVVQTPEIREKLKRAAPHATLKFDTASHILIVVSMKAPNLRYNSPYLEHFMKVVQRYPQNIVDFVKGVYKNFQIKDFKLNDNRSLFDWSSKQSYIALGNMLTSAAMIGIDSCPMEGFNPAIMDDILAEELKLDTHLYGISYMVAFGYRKNDAPQKTRRKLDDIVKFY